MLQSEDFLPTPYLAPNTHPFIDISETGSYSSENNRTNRNESFSELPETVHNLNSPQRSLTLKFPSFQRDTDHFCHLINEIGELSFSDDLYDRAEKFLDQEGLDIELPNIFSGRKGKQTLSLFLSSSLGRSDDSTRHEDSPCSDGQLYSAPSFLVRRTKSGDIKKHSSIFSFANRSDSNGI